MTTRTRSINTGNFPPGKITRVTDGSSANGYPGLPRFKQDMTDVIKDKSVDKPLSMTTVKVLTCEPINGVLMNLAKQVPTYEFSSLIPDGFAHYGNGSHLVPSNSSSFHVPKILMQSNPSRPYVDAGVFIGELKDFPSMGRAIWHNANRIYKGLGRRNMTHRERLDTAFRNSARELTNADEHFIANQFGWLPFVNDVFKFASVGEAIEKRVKELKNLQQRGSKSRTITLETIQDNSKSQVPIHTVWAYLNGTLTRSRSLRVWGSGRYTLEDSSPLKHADSRELFALARKAVMGLHVDGSTAWNLMPWSWLMDWGSNTGDLIASTRNIVGAKASGGVCVMTRRSYATEVRLIKPPGQGKISGGVMQSLVLSRKREVYPSGFVLPEMGVQLLTARQSAILSSLATLRAKRL